MKVLKEPLLHFLILGAALFVLFEWVGGAASDRDNRVVVTPGRVEHLAAGFERTWQRPPTGEELRGLVQRYIREEIYYREALALGLDRDDQVVRRRMTQKLEFLTGDAADALAPSDDELRAYLRAHPERFRVEPRIAFRQVYLNPERHADGLRDVSMRLLQRLREGDVPEAGFEELGDRLMLPARMSLARQGEVGRVFGEGFAGDVLALDPGRWSGPLESAYGLHLVYVSERHDAHLPALDEVRDEVEREWRNDRRKALHEAFYERLRERYEVVVQTPETGTAVDVDVRPEVNP